MSNESSYPVVLITAAPAAYDYGYTTDPQAGSVVLYHTECRVVVVPKCHAEYQLARYRSGGYVSMSLADLASTL